MKQGSLKRPNPASDMYFFKHLMTDIILKKNAKIIVELGVRSIHDGIQATSSKIFYDAIKQTDGVLHSCDINSPSENKDLIEEMLSSDQWVFYQQDDIELYPSLKEQLNHQVDVLFIDTEKTYASTVLELSRYPNLLSDTGIILIHDVGIDYKYTNRKFWKFGPPKAKDPYHKKAQLRLELYDKAIQEFVLSSDFKMSIVLGSYNMTVLFRDQKHLPGLTAKDFDDVCVDNNRSSITIDQCKTRRKRFNKKWQDLIDIGKLDPYGSSHDSPIEDSFFGKAK